VKTRTLWALSLTTLLGACAHQAHHQTGNQGEARAEARAGANHHRETYATAGNGDSSERAAPSVSATPSASASEAREAPLERERASGERGEEHAADNSGVNTRDRSPNSVTPMDQGNGEVDLDLTQRIRKAVMADDSLSFTAKNAKIITRDGRVTLRGPVKSAAEKAAVRKAAVAAAGVGHVSDELEVE
jgi:osmotically-inducible protein OsmY